MATAVALIEEWMEHLALASEKMILGYCQKKEGCYKTIRIRKQDWRVGDAWSHSRLKGQSVEEKETFPPKYSF